MAAAAVDLDLRRRLEAHIDNLPVLPLALANLMALDATAEDYFDRVLQIIEAEPNFAARLLIAANSASSAPSNPVTTLATAIARIGSKGATDLVLALSVTKVFVPRDRWEQSLWRHGVQVAHAARLLATHVPDDEGVRPEEVYACALLHDVGRFVLFQEAPEELRAVDEGDWDTPQTLIDQEQAICGLTHPELGAMACVKWRLPDAIRQSVRKHHDPLPDKLSTLEDKIVAIVRVADLAMFPSAVPGNDSLAQAMSSEELLEYVQPRLPSFLTISGPLLSQLIEQAEADADAACQALGIGH
ncbi:MAG: HDOD domain-containing protein [Acidimicrobiales bacterium]